MQVQLQLQYAGHAVLRKASHSEAWNKSYLIDENLKLSILEIRPFSCYCISLTYTQIQTRTCTHTHTHTHL